MNFYVLKGPNICFDIKILQRGRSKKWFDPQVKKQKIKCVVAFINSGVWVLFWWHLRWKKIDQDSFP